MDKTLKLFIFFSIFALVIYEFAVPVVANETVESAPIGQSSLQAENEALELSPEEIADPEIEEEIPLEEGIEEGTIEPGLPAEPEEGAKEEAVEEDETDLEEIIEEEVVEPEPLQEEMDESVPQEDSVEQVLEEELAEKEFSFNNGQQQDGIDVQEIPDLPAADESEDLLEEELQNVTRGVLDVGLLTGTSLAVSAAQTGDCRQQITLDYEGSSLLNLGVLESSYIIFSLPEELASIVNKNDIVASFDVPWNSGTFSSEKIQVRGNQVEIETNNILKLALLATYKFQLSFTIDAYPPASGTEYLFKAQSTNQSIDLSLLEDNVATTQLAVPESGSLFFEEVPETLAFENTQIDFSNQTIHRKNDNWAIRVSDTRGTGCQWSMQAKTNGPLTSTISHHVLPDALKFIHSQNKSPSVLGTAAIDIFHGVTESDDPTFISWVKDEGPLIQLNTSDALPETYSTTITWTLTNAP